MKRYLAKLRRNKAAKCKRAISNVISTIILTGVLLTILVVASFVSLNILSSQMQSAEFEQAKSNVLLLDSVIQDVSLREGAGSYVQFNEITGGIGIISDPQASLIVKSNGTQVYSCSSLKTMVFNAGTGTSGANSTLRGSPAIRVSMQQPIGYARVETGKGVEIRLDYTRFRVVQLGNQSIGNSPYNFTAITFLRLVQGNMSGSSTGRIMAQNIAINTTALTYPNLNKNLNITAQLGPTSPLTTLVSIGSPSISGNYAVLFSVITVQISKA